jgi:hypothetical protein
MIGGKQKKRESINDNLRQHFGESQTNADGITSQISLFKNPSIRRFPQIHADFKNLLSADCADDADFR